MKNDIKINDNTFEGLKIDGTFDEFIEDVRLKTEVAINKNRQDKLSVHVIAKFMGINRTLPAVQITIYPNVYFAIAQKEFHEYKKDEKRIHLLVHARYIDMLWSANNDVEELFNFLKGVDSEYEIGKYK